jgi:hypothetical protein
MTHPPSKDGCTFWPWKPAWAHCCAAHDADYWFGAMGQPGTLTRSQADNRLYHCIRRSGHPVQAWVAWVGVRAGGWWPWLAHGRRHRRA